MDTNSDIPTPDISAPIPEPEHRPTRKQALQKYVHHSLHRIKHAAGSSAVRTILISALTIIVLLAIAAGIVWHERGRIFKNFADRYAQTVASADELRNPENGLPAAQSDLPALFSSQSLVEDAVSHANPAVVAITISKKVPQYSTSYQNVDPFQNMFGGGDPLGNGFQFQIPVQTPSGTSTEQEVGAGSGFLISADGMIVTNKHVVEDTTADYAVYLSSGKKYTATVLARDSVLDVAIVKINATGLPYLTLGDSSQLKLGQSVIAIGNALGQFQNTISVGVVSGLSRSITAGDEQDNSSESLDHVIQTDAAINPGNSGGPLLDLSGNVIGIDTAIVEGSENIGFALPINTVKPVIDSVRATGKIVRPYLGIRYEEITPELEDQEKLTVDNGAYVKGGEGKDEPAVISGSPASKAGIKEDDVITAVDGVPLDQDSDLSEIIRAHKVGDVVTLTVLRKGAQMTIKVTLEAAPE